MAIRLANFRFGLTILFCSQVKMVLTRGGGGGSGVGDEVIEVVGVVGDDCREFEGKIGEDKIGD